jgi:hypothetical protein
MVMAELNKPQVTPKSSTSRIDLGKGPVVAPAPGIRVGMNPKTTTTRIDISAIPTIAKAQTSRIGLGVPVQPQPVDDDIYKRRTALLDTSKIPLKTTSPAGGPGGSPRTIRIGNRPTVRLTPSAPAAATFSPGRPAESSATAPVAAPAAAPRPAGTIKLKRPGSGANGASISISDSSSTGSHLTSFGPEPSFVTTPEEPEVGAVWAVFSLLSLLAVIGLVVVQIITNNAAAY